MTREMDWTDVYLRRTIPARETLIMDSPVASSPEEERLSPTQTTRPTRRSRVSLACQRCKKRKQKCNGNQPSCARCIELKVECHYVMPINQKPGQAKIYIKALEDRVAELETLLTRGGDTTVSHDHWDEGQDDSSSSGPDGIQPLLNAVRDLSLDVAGSYVGGASTITLGRALDSALAGNTQITMPSSMERASTRGRGSMSSDISSMTGTGTFHLSQLDPEAAQAMVNAYLGHLYATWPIMYSYSVIDLHKRRHCLKDVYEESILNLIYGLGGHFLEKTIDSTASYYPERHYKIALDNREAILGLGDTRSLTFLLLLSQHSLRMPKDPGAWTFIGLAMKMCVELGLHRRRRSSKISFKSELNKRLFWSCYFLEREIAIAMGRPPSLSDHDIDVDLPLDVDEANRDIDVLRQASSAEVDKTIPAFPQKTMTCFIHLLRLRRIDSDIQHHIYRVDRRTTSKDIYEATDMFLEKLTAWKDAIPHESTEWDPTNRHEFRGDEYRSYDSYMASYFKSIRVLLQPRLYEKQINTRYLVLCAEACRGVCETYKRLHYRIPVVFTSISLQTVFLAGLTLIYCMWHDATNSNGFKSIGALTDCSIILYVMSDKWPAGRRYRDLFESVKKSVLDAIGEGKHMPRPAVTSMKDGMKTTLQSLPIDPAKESINHDVEQMLCDMTGQPDFWDDIDMNMGMNDDTNFPMPDEISGIGASTSADWEASDPSLWLDSGFTNPEYHSAVL